MHKKPGYVLFLLFGILTLCMTLVMLFMARSASYQQLMHLLLRQNKTSQLALSSTELAKSLLYVQDPATDYNKKLLQKILKFFNQNKNYNLNLEVDGIDAQLDLYLTSEEGKVDLNNIYNFTQRQFINQQRRSFCEWMFARIATITQTTSLFESFERHLQERNHDFNDVTELLQIPQFVEVFKEKIFYQPTNTSNNQALYLTDLFTVSTNKFGLNPWFLSHSWCKIANLTRSQNLSEEIINTLVSQFRNNANWTTNWNTSLRNLYQIEYNQLQQEIKSVLTTDCEANIFSLLLSATIGETTSTIFTILKKQATGETVSFDIVKVYQI